MSIQSTHAARMTPSVEAAACGDKTRGTQPVSAIDPDAGLILRIADLLVPLFRTSSIDTSFAQQMVLRAMDAYRPATRADFISIARIIGFSMAALGLLGQSSGGDISMVDRMRILGRANALNRSAAQSERTMMQRRRRRPGDTAAARRGEARGSPPVADQRLDEAGLEAAVAEAVMKYQEAGQVRPPAEPAAETSLHETRPVPPRGETSLLEARPVDAPAERSLRETGSVELPAAKSLRETRPAEQPAERSPREIRPAEPSAERSVRETAPVEPSGEMSLRETRPAEAPAERSLHETRPAEPPGETSLRTTRSVEPPAERSLRETQPVEPPSETLSAVPVAAPVGAAPGGVSATAPARRAVDPVRGSPAGPAAVLPGTPRFDASSPRPGGYRRELLLQSAMPRLIDRGAARPSA